MEKNTDRLYTLIITTIIGILFLGSITYGIFQAAHTMLTSQANTTAMRDRTVISKQNISSDLTAITNANIKFNGKDPITGHKVIKEFTKDGLNYSVNTDTSTVSVTGMTNDALSTDSTGHISLTIPKTVTDRQNKSYTVTSIADQAFMNRKIYHVTLPDSIVYIGAQAFYNSHLGDLTQNGKFNDVTVDQYNDKGKRNLTIPSKIKFIGRKAFANNYLYSIIIPNADDLASLDSTTTDTNAIAYKSANQINTSPVDTQYDKAFVKLQYSSASAYDKMVKSSSTQKYTFISGTYADDFIITNNSSSSTTVETNLLINTSSSATNGQTKIQGASVDINGVYSRTDSYEQVTTPNYIELDYRFVDPDTNNLYGLTPGETYTLSGSGSHTTGELAFRSGYSTNRKSWNVNDTIGDLRVPVSDGSVFTPFSYTFTIPVNATGAYFSLQNYDYTNGSLFRFKNMKLVKD